MNLRDALSHAPADATIWAACVLSRDGKLKSSSSNEAMYSASGTALAAMFRFSPMEAPAGALTTRPRWLPPKKEADSAHGRPSLTIVRVLSGWSWSTNERTAC